MVSGGPTTGQLLWFQLFPFSSLLASLQPSRHFAPQICFVFSHLQTFAHAGPSAKNAVSPDLPMAISFSSFQSPIKHQSLWQPSWPCLWTLLSLYSLVWPFSLFLKSCFCSSRNFLCSVIFLLIYLLIKISVSLLQSKLYHSQGFCAVHTNSHPVPILESAIKQMLLIYVINE